MALQIGDAAPDFTLRDETNTEVTLSKLRGENVVLVFYPLDFSPICTGELTALSRQSKRFEDLKAKVYGVSVDSRWTHAAFKRDEKISASLLADFHPKGAVAEKYGVFLPQAGIAKRGTFIIDKAGIIRGVTVNEPGAARDEAAYFETLATCAL